MTTTPVHSITDEQIAEIEALAEDCLEFDWGPDVGMTHAETVYACSVSPSSVLALITRLREAEKDAAPQWISVDDQMPEIEMSAPVYARGVGVIAWGTEWSRPRQLIYKSNGYAKTEKGRAPRWEEIGGGLSFGKPTHWMPLPSPPTAMQDADK